MSLNDQSSVVYHRFDLKGCFYEVLHSAVMNSAKPARILFSALSG